MIGIVGRKQYRNTGVETFQKQVIPNLSQHEGFEKIDYRFSTKYPFSITVSRLRFGRRLSDLGDDYSKIFIPSQDLVSCDPEKVDAEIIPYVHDILPVTTNFSGWVATPLAKHYTQNLEQLDQVICASKHTARELRHRTRFTGKTQVIYQGIEPVETDNVERDIDLLYVGSLIPRKNPDLVRESIRLAEKQGYNCAAVNFEPLDLPCQTYTNVTNKELFQLYRRSRYYIHPSKAEGFGRTPVEAQSQGCVPLALPLPINEEVLGDGFIEVESKNDVVQQLSRKTDLRENARSNAERFDWSETRQQLYEMLTQ